MGTGLTFDEYVVLRLRAPVGADRAFHQAAEMERDRMFPMNTVAAASHLRSRGCDCRPQMLDLLVENGVVALSKPDGWTQTDVDAAAEHFEQCEILTPMRPCARRSAAATPISYVRCVRRRPHLLAREGAVNSRAISGPPQQQVAITGRLAPLPVCAFRPVFGISRNPKERTSPITITD